jgi:hypothetical protein
MVQRTCQCFLCGLRWLPGAAELMLGRVCAVLSRAVWEQYPRAYRYSYSLTQPQHHTMLLAMLIVL